ncbi:MAG: PHB depolymerase family esterase [Phototrophicaceae bacterium]
MMKYRLLIMICFLFMLYGAVSMSHAAEFEASLHTLTHDSLERSYYLYVPTTTITQALIVLHPFGSNGRAMQYVTGLNDFADEHGFVVAYANSANYYWDDGRVTAGLYPDEGNFDDVGFLVTLAETLRQEYAIDSISLTGFENGGHMAYRVACEMPAQFEHVIPVVAVMWDYHIEQCPDASDAVNMLMILGADHPYFIPEGEDIEYLSTGEIFSWVGWQDMVDIWRARNNCPESDLQVIDNDMTVYRDCGDGTTTAFWAFPRGAYNWARMGNNTINRFGVDISAVISAYITDGDWQALTVPEPATVVLARSWVLYVPSSYDPATPTPLIVNLHGRLSNAAAQAYTADFNRIAERDGIIMLYPNGIDTEWNYLRGIVDVDNQTHSDEAFIRSLINDLSIDLNIDRNRMYVTGLSNGGFMTQRLACTMQDEFAAFVSVGATAPFALDRLCEDADPVPMMYIHGTEDTFVRWSGNIVQDSEGTSFYISFPMEVSFNFWSLHNHCNNQISRETLPQVDPETTTDILTLQDCAENSAAILVVVVGGGHVWHGTRTEQNEFLGRNGQDFNSSEMIWEFFQQYQLESRSD